MMVSQRVQLFDDGRSVPTTMILKEIFPIALLQRKLNGEREDHDAIFELPRYLIYKARKTHAQPEQGMEQWWSHVA